MTQSIIKTQQLLAASTASAVGGVMEMSNCTRLLINITVAVSAATLASTTFGIGGTCALDYTTSTFPIVTGGTLITVPPAGWAYSSSTGLLTATSPAVGIHEMTITYRDTPKWIRPVYTYGTGGGAVDVLIVACAWS